MVDRSSPLVSDPCRPYYVDYARLPVEPTQEIELFTTPGPTSAIDVYLIGTGVTGLDECQLRLYAISGGIETLVKQRPLITNPIGRVLRGRGGVSKWRVALQGGSSASLTQELASWSYVAWGREPSKEEGEDDPYMVGARVREWTGQLQVVGSLALATTPCYVRQAFGSLQTAGDTWVQLWANGLGTGNLMSEIFLTDIGDLYNFDFRDPHPLAPSNDGRYVATLHIGASSTPAVYTAAARTLSVAYERRH